jgi:hypothetical protein
MEGDFYSMAESAALMVGAGGQLDIYKQNLGDQEEYKDKLKADYDAKKISQAQYIEGLRNTSDAIIENL